MSNEIDISPFLKHKMCSYNPYLYLFLIDGHTEEVLDLLITILGPILYTEFVVERYDSRDIEWKWTLLVRTSSDTNSLKVELDKRVQKFLTKSGLEDKLTYI